jgi:hypothetical protein
LGASAKCIISLTHSSLCRACSCLVYTHPDRTQECWWRRTGSMAACRGPSVQRTELPLRTFLLFMSVHAKVHDDDRVPCQFCCSQTCRTIIAHAGTPHSLREGPETHNVTSPGPRPTLRSWSECFLWESGHARIASISLSSPIFWAKMKSPHFTGQCNLMEPRTRVGVIFAGSTQTQNHFR